MNLQTFYQDFMMSLHPLYMQIENEGIKVDREKRKYLYDKYTQRFKEVNASLEKHLGHELNVNSPKAVALTLFSELKVPVRNDTGEDTLVALMANNVKDGRRRQIISDILELRRIRKTISTYICALPDYDGRMRTSYRICGTETGRTSTSNLKPPLRPSFKVGTKKQHVGLAFQTLTKHGDVGADIREMLVVDDGFVFIEVDSSQAEARVVALLANDYALLELFDSGRDVHKYTSGRIFGMPEEKIDQNTRFLGKKGRHSFNYDIKKRTFMLDVTKEARKNGIDLTISEWRAGQILEGLHKLHPNVKEVFHAEVQRCLGRDRTLYTPFGRKRIFFGRWDVNLMKEGYAMIPQSTVGDNTKMAMLRAKKRIPEMRIVMEAHDSFTALCPADDEEIRRYATVMKEEMSRPIDFSNCSIPRGVLVIPADLQLGRVNLKELEKFKL